MAKRKKKEADETEPEFYSVQEAAKKKACVTLTVYRAIEAKKLDTLEISSRTLIIKNNDRFRAWTPEFKHARRRVE